jgi:hypothetical protein
MDTIIFKPIITLAMLIIDEPLGLFCCGLLVVLFCVVKFRKISRQHTKLWEHIHAYEKENNKKHETSKVDLATAENRLEMQASRFDDLEMRAAVTREIARDANNLASTASQLSIAANKGFKIPKR